MNKTIMFGLALMIGLLSVGVYTQAIVFHPPTSGKSGRIDVTGMGDSTTLDNAKSDATADEKAQAQAEAKRICTVLGLTLSSVVKGTAPSENTVITQQLDNRWYAFECSSWDYECV